jgi:hypothetical protein
VTTKEEKKYIIDGEVVLVTIIQRPFREGQEILVTYRDEEFSLPEYGFGEEALKEKISAEIKKRGKFSRATECKE